MLIETKVKVRADGIKFALIPKKEEVINMDKIFISDNMELFYKMKMEEENGKGRN